MITRSKTKNINFDSNVSELLKSDNYSWKCKGFVKEFESLVNTEINWSTYERVKLSKVNKSAAVAVCWGGGGVCPGRGICPGGVCPGVYPSMH